MKKLTAFTFALLLLAGTMMHAQDGFEGTVKYSMKQGGMENNLTYSVKGSNFRMDIKAEEEMSIIFTDDKVLMLMPSQKMYMEYPKSMLDMMMEQQDAGSSDEFDIEDLDKFKTGKSKTILGYECEQWLYEDENGTSEIWATNELGHFLFAKNPMQQGGGSMMNIFNETEFFPLLVVVKTSDGQTEVELTAREVKKHEISDSQFSAPEGYNKMTMPGMN